MRGSRVILALLCAAAAYPQSGPFAKEPYEPVSVGEKFKIHMRRIYEPSGLGKSAFTAAINQWQDDPEEWGQGMKGYGRRYGHKLVNRGVENVIGFSVATALKQDPRYFYSGEQGVWRRLKYATASTLVTRTDSGGKTLSVWRLTGNYGAAFISNAWRPSRINSSGDALVRGTIAIGYDFASNIFKEFWPDIKRKFFRR
jgi:hypothetical protein